MLTFKQLTSCALFAFIFLFATGCRKSAETPASPPPQATQTATAAAPARHHKVFPGGISPLIVSLSPETVPFHNGYAPMQRYSLTYEIENWQKATKAYISIFIPGLGEIQKSDVDLQARGTIEFFLDPSKYDLGPTVRFRAHCPGGDSDWFFLGGDPVRFPQRPAPGQIGSVMPEYVLAKRAPSTDGVQIYISGPQITKDCTPEAQVDGTAVELHNVIAFAGEIRGMLLYNDLQGRTVVSRHIEVKLLVFGPGLPAEDVYNLPFVE